jgi:hypothetical protein
MAEPAPAAPAASGSGDQEPPSKNALKKAQKDKEKVSNAPSWIP